MSIYHTYGSQHGTAFYYDASKPNSDSFLDYMERRLTKRGLGDYIDGFMAGILGDDRWEHTQMAGLKKGGVE